MSIINDAIKKARHVYKINTPKEQTDALQVEQREYIVNAPQEKKTIISQHKAQYGIIISLVFFIAFLIAVILYKQASRVSTVYVPVAPVANIETSILPPLAQSAPLKNSSPITRFENVLELEGIVYDDSTGEKWAIINNNIFKEGDPIMGGKVLLIMKDHVKVEKGNKGTVVLNLKR